MKKKEITFLKNENYSIAKSKKGDYILIIEKRAGKTLSYHKNYFMKVLLAEFPIWVPGDFLKGDRPERLLAS